MDEEISLCQLLKLKKEQFNVQIRQKQRSNILKALRKQHQSTQESPPAVVSLTSDQEDKLNNFMDTLIQAIEDQVALFQESEDVFQLNLPGILDISLKLKQEMKTNPRHLQSISQQSAKTLISAYLLFNRQSESLAINLSFILYYLSTTSHLPAVMSEIGGLDLFEQLLDTTNSQIIQSGLSIILNTIAGSHFSIQLLMESSIFYQLKLILADSASSFSSKFMVLSLFNEYLDNIYCSSERQTQCIELLFYCLQNMNCFAINPQLVELICEGLSSWSIEQVMLGVFRQNSGNIIIQLFKLLRIHRKNKNNKALRALLELVQLIVEKDFLSIDLDVLLHQTDCLRILSKLVVSNNYQIVERVYDILQNLVAESLKIAIKIIENQVILHSIQVHSQVNKLSVIYDMSYFIRNLFFKIEHIGAHFAMESSTSPVIFPFLPLVKVLHSFLVNYPSSVEITSNAIRSIQIFSQYCDFNFETQLFMKLQAELERCGMIGTLSRIYNSNGSHHSEVINYILDLFDQSQLISKEKPSGEERLVI